MRKHLLVATLMVAVLCLGSTYAGALSFNHNLYALLDGKAIVHASGTSEVTFGTDGSFTGSGTWADLNWDIAGQMTGSDVSYAATIPDVAVQQSGSAGDFAFGAYYNIVDANLDYGVALFTRPGATGWLGTWKMEVENLSGHFEGEVEITSADNGILTGAYTQWPTTSDRPAFTGSYSPDGTFQIVIPDWGHCTLYGHYGTGWHGYLSAPGSVGYFIDNNLVPEPSALVALFTGMIGTFGLIRRKH